MNELEILTDKQFFRCKRLNSVPHKRPADHAVIFVHGFAGDLDTWTCPYNNETFWGLLSADEELTDHAFYVFKYKTGVFSGSVLENVVTQLRSIIDSHIDKNTKVILIAHSMGGVVAMRYVIRLIEDNYPHRIGGLLLYGCPMTGVEWIKYARALVDLASSSFGPFGKIANVLFRRHRQLPQIAAESEFIEKLNSDWIAKVLNGGDDSLPAHQRAWIPVKVVTGNDDWVVKQSAAKGLYSNRDWIPVDTDHRSLVKPSSRTDRSYQIASEFLKECRNWPRHDTLMELRKVLGELSKLRHRLHVRHFEMSLTFENRRLSDHEAKEFGITEFMPFNIRCSYTRVLTTDVLAIGCANGSISFGELWNDKLVFLHGFSVNTLDDGARNKLGAITANASSAWKRVIRDPYIKIDGQELRQTTVERRPDGFLLNYDVPEELRRLPGREHRIEIGFTTLLEPDSKGYILKLPWMAHGVSVTAGVTGETDYFTATSGLPLNQVVDKKEERRKVKYSTDELVLPGSTFSFRWKTPERSTGLKAFAAGADR